MRRLHLLVAVAVATALIAGASSAPAATYWQVPWGDWSTSSSWTNGVPGSATDALIGNGGTAYVSGPPAACRNLTVGQDPGTSGAMHVTGVLTALSEVIGDAGTGTVTHASGVHVIQDQLVLGRRSTGVGDYVLQAGMLQAREQLVGSSGQGRFVQTGGANLATAHLEVGKRGRYQISGGLLNVAGGLLGVQGEFISNGGTVVAGDFALRPGGTFSGNSEGTLLVNSLLGFADAAAVDVDWLKFGHPGGTGTGSFTLSGSQVLTGPRHLVVGSSAPATLTHTGGSAWIGELLLGESPGGDGTYNLGGAGYLSMKNDLVIGGAATGRLWQYGGAAVGFGDLILGRDPGADGTYELVGGNATIRGSAYVGLGGAGSVEQDGGTLVLDGDVHLGAAAGSTGRYTIGGGRLQVPNGSIKVGGAGTGRFAMGGGEVTADAITLFDNGELQAWGGNLSVNTVSGIQDSARLRFDRLAIGINTGSGPGSFELAGSQVLTVTDLTVGATADATFTHSGGSATVRGPLVLGQYAGISGEYRLGGRGSVHAEGDATIGKAGMGKMFQTGGSHVVEGQLAVGSAAGSDGTYELNQGDLAASSAVVGDQGTGWFKQTGGMFQAGSVSIGQGTGAGGTFEMLGGDLYVIDGAIQVGVEGAADFRFHNGFVIAERLALGPRGTFSTHGLGSLRVNSLTGLGDHVGLDVESLEIGHPGGTGHGSYSLVDGQSLAVSGILHLGVGAGATFEHSGGTNTVGQALALGTACPGSPSGVATYQLSGTGQLAARSEHVGYRAAEGRLVQTGGTNTTGVVVVGDEEGASGSYRLTGGALLLASRDGAPDSPPLLIVGEKASGVFELGNASQTGEIKEAAAALRADMVIRESGHRDASGTFRGWGTVDLTGSLENNGRIIADGYGTDRTLDLSRFTSVTNDDSAGIAQGDGTQAGWYAENHGALRLPPISVSLGSNSYNWGENADDTSLDLVNSVRVTFDDVDSGGPLYVTLRATDYGLQPGPPGADVIGMWDFAPSRSLLFDSAELQIRYDDALAEALGLSEEDLLIYQLTDNHWQTLASTVDPVHHLITAGDLNILTRFAVGSLGGKLIPVRDPSGYRRLLLGGASGGNATAQVAVPEPSASILGLMGGLAALACLLRRRPWRAHPLAVSPTRAPGRPARTETRSSRPG